MLKQQLEQIVRANPEYAAITPVIEKEILQHDIMDVLVKQGAMQSLTFIGGTSLRMCFNSSRLSEDLDFNGGMTSSRQTLMVWTLKYSITFRKNMKPKCG